jgi:hypothetical protein
VTALATGIQRDRIAPPELQRYLRQEGGRNPHGEPMFRLVWGASRMTWRTGEWEDRDPDSGVLIKRVVEARQVPKYGYALERWHIESWHPPEWYGSPEDWPRQWIGGKSCETLGEFPSRGGYESIDVLEMRNPDGTTGTIGFEPSRAYLEHFARFIGFSDIRCLKIQPTADASPPEVAAMFESKLAEAEAAARAF